MGIDTTGRSLGAVLAVALTASCAAGPSTPAAPPTKLSGPTRISEFEPWRDGLVLNHIPKRGVCEKPSEAVARADAWLCEVRGEGRASDGELFEPCLAHPSEPKAACPVGQDFFYVVDLASPLPARPAPTAEVEPWIVLLASGERCVSRSGIGTTIPARDGLAPTMRCYPPDPGKPSWFGDFVWGPIDRTGEVWTVRTAPNGEPGLHDAEVAVAYR